MSDFLYILQNEVQIIALSFLGIVYVIRVIWLFRFQSQRERTYPAGSENSGILLSMMTIAMPWAMESIRKKPGFYVQFAIFHLGVIAAITATFIIPYWPQLFESRGCVVLFQILVGAAFFVGVMRLFRRITNPAVRLISTADDYFSLVLMTVYFAVAVWAIPNTYEKNEWPLILFFALTAFFLVYVPFSKIGHYLYYPFTRFFIGRTMGHRGVGQRIIRKPAGEGR
jgi:nitrate reductase gamma subunit